jgi:hypothetical protein
VWDIRSIVHPTDFSEASAAAFAHALRIALSTKAMLTLLKAMLTLLHVAHAHPTEEWTSFPHVRQTLAAGVYGDTTVFTVNLLGGDLVRYALDTPDAGRAKRARGMWRMPQPPGRLRTTNQKHDSLSHNPEGQADQS